MIEQLEATDGILSELMHERAKQISKGYDSAHDDADAKGKHAQAGAYYAAVACYQREWGGIESNDPSQFDRLENERLYAQAQANTDSVGYPWPIETARVERSPRANLVKAAALLIAEIERIDREMESNDED